MDLTAALRALVRTVERGSITAAARDLGISQPAVSKLLRGLEERVGTRLFERSTRAVRPTAQGLSLYEATGAALASIDAAIEGTRSEAGKVAGVLRLHAPTCIGERHLHRIVMDFQDAHPDVSVELTLENRSVDLIFENVDLALRMGRPTDQTLIIRRIGMSRRILVASQDYLNARGQIRSLGELGRHSIVVTNASLRGGALCLRKGKEKADIRVAPKMTTNNAQILIDALKAGRGIGTAQVLLVADELRRGELVRVLPRYEIEPTELYLVYPSSKFLRPTVRAFVDFAMPALRRIEGIF